MGSIPTTSPALVLKRLTLGVEKNERKIVYAGVYARKTTKPAMRRHEENNALGKTGKPHDVLKRHKPAATPPPLASANPLKYTARPTFKCPRTLEKPGVLIFRRGFSRPRHSRGIGRAGGHGLQSQSQDETLSLTDPIDGEYFCILCWFTNAPTSVNGVWLRGGESQLGLGWDERPSQRVFLSCSCSFLQQQHPPHTPTTAIVA